MDGDHDPLSGKPYGAAPSDAEVLRILWVERDADRIVRRRVLVALMAAIPRFQEMLEGGIAYADPGEHVEHREAVWRTVEVWVAEAVDELQRAKAAGRRPRQGQRRSPPPNSTPLE